MNNMDKKIALVTHALDFVGPAAVNALWADGYTVVTQDPAFQEATQQEAYQSRYSASCVTTGMTSDPNPTSN